MAEIIKKVTGTVKKTAQNVGKKATDIANTTKQSVLLKSKNMELGKLLKELGTCYYAFVRESKETEEVQEAEAKLAECLAKVEKLKDEIALLRAKIAKEKGEFPCPSCGVYVSSSKENVLNANLRLSISK